MAEKKNVVRYVRFGLIGCFLLAMGWAYCSEAVINEGKDYEYKSIDDSSWVQIIDDTRIELDSLEDVQSVPLGDRIVLETTLTTVWEDEELYFYSENQEVWVYVADECIYSFEMQEGYEILQTPGSTWNVVPLTEEMSGQVLRIEYQCNFSYYQKEIHTCYVGDKADMLSVQLRSIAVLTILSLCLLVLSITSYINGFIWKHEKLRKIITNIGDLYLCVSLWLLSEVGFFDIFLHKPLASYLASMILLRILPIVLCKFVRDSLPREYKALNVISIVSVCNLILACILQMCFGIPFVDLLLLNNVMIIIGSVIFAIVHIDSMRYITIPFTEEDIYIFDIILVVGGVIDVICFYRFSEYSMIMGGITAAAFIVYAIIVHVILLNYETRIDDAKRKMEVDYRRLQSVSLMQEIKAHFIFNTLNTISSLCKYDARAADNGIKMFSRYLRSYMYLINQHDNISFYDELQLVEAYLEIEKLRFGEDFTYEIQVDYGDFVLPPLSIQPLVENAVNHGIRKTGKIGNLKIVTRKEENTVVIVIEDNGVGFDVNLLEAHNSIGITNMRKRVDYMTKGTVEIDSTIGHGTSVTITLPLKENEV